MAKEIVSFHCILSFWHISNSCFFSIVNTCMLHKVLVKNNSMFEVKAVLPSESKGLKIILFELQMDNLYI